MRYSTLLSPLHFIPQFSDSPRISTRQANAPIANFVAFLHSYNDVNMVSKDDLPEQFDSEFHLQRIPRTHDLLSLASKSGEASGRCTASHPLQRHSMSSGSENGDFLYMAISRTQDRRGSTLSQISNRSTPRLDEHFDGNGASRDGDAADDATEQFSWGIINREIYEWEHTCRSRFPHWWSPKAKSGHSKLGYAPNSQSWVRQIDEKSIEEYNVRRRAVSDSFLADPSTVEEMAHMIAVQLLSSCYTLSPDLAAPPSPQSCRLSEKNWSTNPKASDSSMISSLRMHTRYRYSPCFGHQGRNTSPVSTHPGTYDDLSPCSSSPPAATGMQTPDINTSVALRRRRIHRALHVTEGSASNCSLDSHTDQYLKLCKSDITADPIVRVGSRLQQQLPQGDNSEENYFFNIYRKEKAAARERTTDALDQDLISNFQGCPARPKSKFELNLITRSEPLHDFIQPAKDLAVRRWQNLRRRFGSSSHSLEQLVGSGDVSRTSSSRASSPVAENDGRERRRRAQASGDISSYESMPHYNSPVSSRFSLTGSGTSSPARTENGTVLPSFPPTESLAIGTSPTFGHVHESITKINEAACYNTSPKVETCPDCQAHTPPSGRGCDSQSMGKTDQASQPDLSSMSLTVPSCAIRNRRRQRGKSMLSEVYTAGDLVDEATASGSNDELESNILNSIPTAFNSLKTDVTLALRVLPGDSDSNGLNMEKRKPRLSRTSTSGTQVFSPTDDGVEIDGLPVGLCRHAWDGPGKKRERSYL